MKPNLLIVDDDELIRNALRRTLRDRFRVELAESAAQAIELFMSQRFDIVISDLKMPGMNGLSLLGWAAKHAPETRRILLTGFTDIEATPESVAEAEIFKVLHKPWDTQDLIDVLISALEITQAGG